MEITIRIDSRLRLENALLPAEVRKELIERCTHENAAKHKLARAAGGARGARRSAMQFALRSAPDTIPTWRDAGLDLTLSRGCLGMVRSVLTAHGIQWRYDDSRTRGIPIDLDTWPSSHKPESKAPDGGSLRWYQEAAVEACIAKQNCLMRAPTGCLDGSALIAINRGGKGMLLRLSELVAMLRGGKRRGRTWDLSIPTRVRSPQQNGRIVLARIISASESGVQSVYAMSVQSPTGPLELWLTKCHRVLTPVGWRRLDELYIHHLVMVGTAPTGSTWFEPGYGSILDPVPILKIEYVGERPTFDLEVEETSAFMANGIAVHNSGKTSSLIAIVARLKLSTLVVVDNAELARQWSDRLIAELGLDAEQIGRIGGGERVIKPITIGMRQTLASAGVAASLRDAFGLVIVDEVHRAASSTFIEVVDVFASRYRIGASADESRKDGKECLIYDVFGDVAHEVSRDDLIAEGSVLDVEIRLVPTEFRADWYVAQLASGFPDFNKLLDELTADAERNAIVLELARAEAEAGEQVIVLTHRVEHAEGVAASLEGLGRPTRLMLGGADRTAERAAAIDAMRAGSLRAAVGTIQSIGTGIDIPSVSRGVLATPIGNNRQLFSQIRGRICRPGKSSAALYVLWDWRVNGAATLRRMIEWNHSVVVRCDDGSWQDGRERLRQWKRERALDSLC